MVVGGCKCVCVCLSTGIAFAGFGIFACLGAFVAC